MLADMNSNKLLQTMAKNEGGEIKEMLTYKNEFSAVI